MSAEPLSMSSVTLVIERVAAKVGISREALTLEASRDPFTDEMAYTLTRKVATWQPPSDDIVVPASWWDHWKHEHRESLLFHAFIAAHPPRLKTYVARLLLPDFPVEQFHGQHVTKVPYWQEVWR